MNNNQEGLRNNNSDNSNTSKLPPLQPVNTKYKTQMCRHFEAQGICHLGERCHYAHGEKELRNANDVILISLFLHRQ